MSITRKERASPINETLNDLIQALPDAPAIKTDTRSQIEGYIQVVEEMSRTNKGSLPFHVEYHQGHKKSCLAFVCSCIFRRMCEGCAFCTKSSCCTNKTVLNLSVREEDGLVYLTARKQKKTNLENINQLTKMSFFIKKYEEYGEYLPQVYEIALSWMKISFPEAYEYWIEWDAKNEEPLEKSKVDILRETMKEAYKVICDIRYASMARGLQDYFDNNSSNNQSTTNLSDKQQTTTGRRRRSVTDPPLSFVSMLAACKELTGSESGEVIQQSTKVNESKDLNIVNRSRARSISNPAPIVNAVLTTNTPATLLSKSDDNLTNSINHSKKRSPIRKKRLSRNSTSFSTKATTVNVQEDEAGYIGGSSDEGESNKLNKTPIQASSVTRSSSDSSNSGDNKTSSHPVKTKKSDESVYLSAVEDHSEGDTIEPAPRRNSPDHQESSLYSDSLKETLIINYKSIINFNRHKMIDDLSRMTAYKQEKIEKIVDFIKSNIAFPCTYEIFLKKAEEFLGHDIKMKVKIIDFDPKKIIDDLLKITTCTEVDAEKISSMIRLRLTFPCSREVVWDELKRMIRENGIQVKDDIDATPYENILKKIGSKGLVDVHNIPTEDLAHLMLQKKLLLTSNGKTKKNPSKSAEKQKKIKQTSKISIESSV